MAEPQEFFHTRGPDFGERVQLTESDVGLSEASVREYAQQWARYPMSQDIAARIQDVLDALTATREKFEASQALADQAIRERDHWHERWDFAQDELDRRIPHDYRAATVERTHDGVLLSKAVHPRGVTG